MASATDTPGLIAAGAMMNAASAVLFDLDGTLIDTHIDFAFMRREVIRLAQEAGVDPPLEEQPDVLGLVATGCDRLEREQGRDAARRFRAATFARLEEIETAQCAAPVTVEGAAELLATLRASGRKVAVVTRNSRAVSEQLLSHGGLQCDVLLARDDVPRTKPDPEHLLEALRLLSGDKALPIGPEDAVMVGDHWMDVLAGRRAGCRTVGVLRGREASFFDPAPPDLLVNTVANLLEAVSVTPGGLKRRDLIGLAGTGLLSVAVLADSSPGWAQGSLASGTTAEAYELELNDIPSYCSHEHWGSISSFGMVPEGFRADVVAGATPVRRTGLMDVLLDPYFTGWLASSGVDLAALASRLKVGDLRDLTGDALASSWAAISEAARPHRATGTFQAIRLGLLELHGVDIRGPESASQADARVARAYQDVFGWYREAMQRVRMHSVIRPVHPEFYWSETAGKEAEHEAAHMRTVLRIDPFLDFWRPQSPRRDSLAARVGIEPTNPASWRSFLEAVFARAAAGGALGIKQLQAYTRSLEFRQPGDAEVRFRGELSAEEVRTFQDWVVHECCKLANDRRWPHQIHVGTHNLPHSSPLPLASMAARYPHMPVVQLHCWPFPMEAGWLAWRHPNVYLDTCWLAVLNPRYLHEALDTWLGLVPTAKIMCGHDATSIEMAAGALAVLRRTLGEVLGSRVKAGALTNAEARDVAVALMHDNAAALYGWQAPPA